MCTLAERVEKRASIPLTSAVVARIAPPGMMGNERKVVFKSECRESKRVTRKEPEAKEPGGAELRAYMFVF
jgi:hypothetical protein